MKLKKIAAAILAAGVLAISAPSLGAVPTASANAPYIVESDFEYIVNGDGETVTITKYIGTDTDLIIPSALDGKKVIDIDPRAFDYLNSDNIYEYNTFIKTITLPDDMNIGEHAPEWIERLSVLEEIKVSDDNKYYSSVNGALFNKDKTTLVRFPVGITGTYEIPDTTTTIGEGAFHACVNLTGLTIPKSVVTIEDYTFDNYSFTGCQHLENIDVDADNPNFSSVNGVLFDKGKTKLIKYPTNKSGETYDIPEGVTTINKFAFEGCWLENVTIPNSVTTIGEAAFEWCSSIKNITIPKSVTAIGSDAFQGCYNLAKIEVPSSVVSIGFFAFGQCNSLESIDVDTNNKNYMSEDGVLFDINKTTLIQYPAGKKETKYSIPTGVTVVGEDAFSRTVYLSDIIIPKTVTTIKGLAFLGCSNLTNITMPTSVTLIDVAAFDDCPAIETVYYGGTQAEWEDIEIVEFNDDLINANIIFNSTPDEPETSEPTSSDKSETTTPSSSSGSSASTETSEPETSVPAPNEEDFHPENEVSGTVEESPDAKDIPDDDRIKTVTINPAFNMKNKNGDNVELDLSKVSIKASEIYDEEGLKRAEEALGQTIKGNKHYNLLDLTLLYDGEDFSNGYEGLVKVVIPLPKGHRDKVFSCYRLVEVNGKMEKQEIPGTQTEDSYVIYLEHFSLYALVADDAPADTADDTADETPTVPADTTKNPQTGAAVALIPTALAAGAVLAVSRKRK